MGKSDLTFQREYEQAARELLEHANEMFDDIDGAEESRGHDSALTRWGAEAEHASYLLHRAAAMTKNWQDWLSLQSGDVQAMVKDAQRYRWLRDSESPGTVLVKMLRLPAWGGFKSGAETDEAIDAAIAAQDAPDDSSTREK